MPKPLNFYVFITYDNLTQNSLRIPIEFKTERHKQIMLNDSIILTVSDGKKWPMGWKILNNGHLGLQKGWPEFAEHYRIKIGHLLLFNHQENSSFHIRMFDRDSCEITYFPFTKAPQTEKEIDHTGLQTKSSFQHMEVSIELASKQRPKERALTSVVLFKSDNPFYSVRVTASFLRLLRLPIPNAFSRRYLTGAKKSDFETNMGYCILQMPDGGKCGPIQCKEYTNGCRMYGKNWKKFSNEHLIVDDVCVFELINEIEKVLKVTIIRAS